MPHKQKIWVLKTKEQYQEYLTFIKGKFKEAVDIPNSHLCKLIQNEAIDRLVMSSSRWIGKSTLMAYWSLLNLIYNPDFNALWVGSFQTQNRTRLREPLEKALSDLIAKKIIGPSKGNAVYFNDRCATYNGKKILFGDVNNLGNILGTQPKTLEKHGHHAVYALVFFEELIYDGQSEEEERRAMIAADSIISGLQNRGGETHPFLKLRQFFAFNPWCAHSEFYHSEIEEKLPLGFEYVKEERQQIAQRNRAILIEKGEIFKTYEEASSYDTIVKAIWRGCYTLIPKHRFSARNEHELLQIKDSKLLVDKRKYQVIYLGIHAPMITHNYVYSAYLRESPSFLDVKTINPEYIMIGIDRGVVDHTAVVVVVPYIENNIWKLYIHETLSFSGIQNRSGIQTSKNIIEYFKKLIKEDWVWSYLQRLPIYILCEPKAVDFNEFLWNDLIKNTVVGKYFHFMKGDTYKPHWKINTRIDFVGRLLRYNRILFNKDNNSLLLWKRLQECITKNNGERDETGKNRLDEINALELAISKKRLRDNFYRRLENETLS